MALKEEPSDAEDLVKTDGYITLSQAEPPRQPNARAARDPPSTPAGDGQEVSALKAQLREAEERAQEVQREVSAGGGFSALVGGRGRACMGSSGRSSPGPGES